MERLQGTWTALITPFNEDKSVDFDALGRLIEFQIENGISGLLLMGTTGEAPAMSKDEREQVIRFGIEKIAGRVPVMVGTGTNNVDKSIDCTNRAKKFGADFALVITPYYNRTTQEGLYQFFKKIVENTDIPIVMYNVPSRTGMNLEAATAARLACDFPRIVGIKEATGNLVQVTKILKDAPDDFVLLSGDDDVTIPIMAATGKGVISVTSNVAPKAISQMVKAWQDGDYPQAVKANQYLSDLNSAMFMVTNPIPVKDALWQMGMIKREYRLPMWTLNDQLSKNLTDILKKYKLI